MSRIDGFEDLVLGGGDNRICIQSENPIRMMGGRHTRQLQQVQLQHASNNWNFVLCQTLFRNQFAVVNFVSKMVCCFQWNIDKPHVPSSLIALKIRVMVIQVGE